MRREIPAVRPAAAVVFCLVASVLASAAWGQAPAAAPAEDPRNAAVREALQLRINTEFLDTPFSRVIELYARETGVNFVLDPDRRSELADRAITLRMQGMPVAEGLRWVSEMTDAEWSVVDGVVFVSTRHEMMRRRRQTRVYDIRPFLLVLQNHRGPDLSIDKAIGNTNSGGSNSRLTESGGARVERGGGLFGDEDEEAEATISREELVEQIVTLIKDTTGDPLDWLAAGGDLFSVREIKDSLVVVATPEVHEQIATLLTDLQAAGGRTVAVEAEFLVAPRAALRERARGAVVDPAAADRLVDELLAAGGKRLAGGRTVCFNGQRVYLYGGRDRLFLSDAGPVPDAGSADVTLSTLRSGAVLDVMPMISFDGRDITLVVKSDLGLNVGSRQAAVPITAGRPGAELDVETDGRLSGDVSEGDERGSITGEVNSTGSIALPGPQPVIATVPLDMPAQDMVSHRTSVRVQDGGAAVLTAASAAIEGVDPAEADVVLVLRARALP